MVRQELFDQVCARVGGKRERESGIKMENRIIDRNRCFVRPLQVARVARL